MARPPSHARHGAFAGDANVPRERHLPRPREPLRRDRGALDSVTLRDDPPRRGRSRLDALKQDVQVGRRGLGEMHERLAHAILLGINKRRVARRRDPGNDDHLEMRADARLVPAAVLGELLDARDLELLGERRSRAQRKQGEKRAPHRTLIKADTHRRGFVRSNSLRPQRCMSKAPATS